MNRESVRSALLLRMAARPTVDGRALNTALRPGATALERTTFDDLRARSDDPAIQRLALRIERLVGATFTVGEDRWTVHLGDAPPFEDTSWSATVDGEALQVVLGTGETQRWTPSGDGWMVTIEDPLPLSWSLVP